MADALAGRAAWAPLAAADGWDLTQTLTEVSGPLGVGSGGPSVSALAGWVRQCVRTEQTRVTGREDASTRHTTHVDLGTGNGTGNGEQVRGLLSEPRPVREGVRGGADAVHLIRVGGADAHPDCWVTLCGWRFARRPHVRCAGALASCGRYLRAEAAQSGGWPAAGAQPAGTAVEARSTRQPR